MRVNGNEEETRHHQHCAANPAHPHELSSNDCDPKNISRTHHIPTYFRTAYHQLYSAACDFARILTAQHKPCLTTQPSFLATFAKTFLSLFVAKVLGLLRPTANVISMLPGKQP